MYRFVWELNTQNNAKKSTPKPKRRVNFEFGFVPFTNFE